MNSFVDHRNSDLSDIQEEEEDEEEEEEELGSRPCSSQKQVAGNRENGAKVMGWGGDGGPQTSGSTGLHSHGSCFSKSRCVAWVQS